MVLSGGRKHSRFFRMGATVRARGVILLNMSKNRQWIAVLFGAALMLAPGYTVARAQNDQGTSAKQDMKDAGRDTKAGAKDAGKGVKKGSEKSYKAGRNDTKKAYSKTKNTTKGAVNGGKEGAKEPPQ